MELIHSGWLVKSPGARYINILKGKVQFPVKAKWRRRFFRLYRKSASSADSQVKFSYYQDESLQKKLGSIKLENCVKIQSSLDSACYQHLFALQTSTMNNRVFYLAADTEQEMNDWVFHLCQLCEFIDAPQPTDTGGPVSVTDNELDVNQQHTNVDTMQTLTGDKTEASPLESDSNTDDYDVPQSAVSTLTESAALAPPTVSSALALSQTSGAVSSGEEGSLDDEDLYENTNGIVNCSDDVYDVPTSSISWQPPAPPRPPKLSTLASEEEEADYTNISFNDTCPVSSPTSINAHTHAVNRVSTMSIDDGRLSSSVLTRAANDNPDEIYDIPKNLFTAPPAFCHGRNTRPHKYINASTQFVDTKDEPLKPPRDVCGEADAHTSILTQDPSLVESEEVYDIVDSHNSSGHTINEQSSQPQDTVVVRISQTSRTRSYIRDSAFCKEPGSKDIVLPIRSHSIKSGESSSESLTSDSEQIYDSPPSRPSQKPTTVPQPQASIRLSKPQPAPRSMPTAAPRVKVIEHADLEHSTSSPPVSSYTFQSAEAWVAHVELDQDKVAAIDDAVSSEVSNQ